MAKQTEKPNVITAVVTSMDYDFPNATYDIRLTNKKTFERLPEICIYEEHAGFSSGTELILWQTVFGKTKYVATKTEIFNPKYFDEKRDGTLNPITQMHFDKYTETFNGQQALKKDLVDIQQKKDVLESIIIDKTDASEEKRINDAKNAITEFLNKKIGIIKSQITKKIKI